MEVLGKRKAVGEKSLLHIYLLIQACFIENKCTLRF